MVQDIVEMSKDLVLGLIEAGLLKPENMQQELQNIHATLVNLKAREAGETSGDGPMVGGTAGAVNWRKSIKKHAVECLVCGETFKQLSARHLSNHDLDPKSYRQRFGIPGTQPLSAKATTAMRRQVVQKIRPWEKAPTYVKSQEQEVTPEPAATPKRTRRKARAWGCWGKPQNSDRMGGAIHLPLEPGEPPLCVSNYNSSSVTMTVMKRASSMSLPSTKTSSASSISG